MVLTGRITSTCAGFCGRQPRVKNAQASAMQEPKIKKGWVFRFMIVRIAWLVQQRSSGACRTSGEKLSDRTLPPSPNYPLVFR
jgi:hypothetical protein